MPELPEIEHLKRSLEPFLIGAFVRGVKVHRADVVHRHGKNGADFNSRRVPGRELLANSRIVELKRHGKHLAIINDTGRTLCVHLGMSGQLRFLPARQRMPEKTHVHCQWRLDLASPASTGGEGRLFFRDPRRFGGLWLFASLDELHQHRWSHLGPDALAITADELIDRLARTTRPIKGALLEQSTLAGVGNIYADESLFAARIHPLSIACEVPRPRLRDLCQAIHDVLNAAIHAGGSTIRSYHDANGAMGSYAVNHQVYGRGDQRCCCCSHTLVRSVVGQRTTVFCVHCQRRYG